MTNDASTMTALQASAMGMRAYRDSADRLWISLPDDRLPGELRSVALALLKEGYKAPRTETKAGALLLRVLSWADGAGVSVRQILETVRDATGPDEAAIAELEQLVTNLRARPAGTDNVTFPSPPNAAAAAPAVANEPVAIEESVPASMIAAPTLAPAGKEEFYPTPIWISRLLQHPMELRPAEPTTVLIDAPAAEASSVGQLRNGSTETEFRKLIEQISDAVTAARASAPGKDMPELEPAERVLWKVETDGVEAYQRANPLLAEQILMMGPEILSRIDKVAKAYRLPGWLRRLQA